MNDKKEILREFLRENRKGFYIAEVQLRYFQAKLEVSLDEETKTHCQNHIAELEKVQKQYLEHVKIIKAMLEEDKGGGKNEKN